MRILFAGGGSGGHFTPIIAIIRELKNLAEAERILDLELFYMGPDSFGEDLLQEEGVLFLEVPAGKVRRYASFKNFLDMFRLAYGLLKALWNIFLIMPDVIFSKGGYGAFPAVAASIVFRIPLIIHESDSIPGKVNLFSARFAKRIGISFSNASSFFPQEKTALVGVPVRKRILGGNLQEAKDDLGVFSAFPVVGFTGASQGAEVLNTNVLGVLKELADEFEVVHQTGAAHIEDIKAQADIILEFGHKERYHPFGFLDEGMMRAFYLASDIIVARASATTIFEIAAWGKPAILIPLRNAAQDHQRTNAYEYSGHGAAVVIEETNLTPHILLAEIRKVLADQELLKKMSEAAQRFARIDSAEIIAREILQLGVH